MADAALFIGWGQVVRGREKRALQVFNEVALLYPHGGDLQGLGLLRRSEEQISALQTDEEFQRMLTRADQVIDSLGAVPAVIGEGLARSIAQYQGEIDDLD